MISSQDLVARFEHASTAKATELDIALLVAQVIEPTFTTHVVLADFDLYLNDIRHQQIDTPQGLLDWCTNQGYGAAKPLTMDLQSSHVRWTMQHRQGLPITLAVILIEIARRMGIDSHGINFPGHFIVSIGGELIDPVTMQIVDPAQLGRGQVEAKTISTYLQPATPLMLGLRMLNNVKAFYLQQLKLGDALNVLDYQLALATPDPMLQSTLHFERGEIWARLGSPGLTRRAFETCVKLASTSAIANKARQHLARMEDDEETVH